jgi:prepilin-type N-terminal cleavage/methylation domain-containing protein
MTRRQGFTLIEVIVWIAVLTILAATLTPALLAVVDAERRDRAMTLLTRIDSAVTAFDGDVNMYPSSITQMLEGIGGGDQDLCGTRYKNSDARKWEGPYVHMVPGPNGLPIVIGYVADAFAYQVIGGTPYLRITITDVLEEDAEALDAAGEAVDGDLGANAGVYRWGAPDADGFVTLTYDRVVMAC